MMTAQPLPRIDLGTCERLVVISDVHLHAPDDALSQTFFKMLETIQGSGALVFLGDIFDFIYADSRYFLKRWQRFFEMCEKLRARGLKVVFVEGNHDFGFRLNEKLSRYFDACGDIELLVTQPKLGKFVLRHGDDVICRPEYRRFRRVVKSRTIENIVTQVPHFLIDWACLRWANASRNRHETYTVDRPFIESNVAELISGEPTFYRDVAGFVFGHIHVDANFVLKSGARFVSGPDWLACPSLLTIDHSGIARTYLGNPPHPSQVSVIHDKGEPGA